MPKRAPINADYVSRRALWLPERARYDVIMDEATTSGSDLPKLVTDAMTAIEASSSRCKESCPKIMASSSRKCLKT